jgi:uncharacterized protein YbaR (Trm112 family)
MKMSKAKVHKHKQAIIIPGSIVKKGDNIEVSSFENGTMYCKDCNEQLPIEDRVMFSSENTFVALPNDVVDDQISS